MQRRYRYRYTATIYLTVCSLNKNDCRVRFGTCLGSGIWSGVWSATVSHSRCSSHRVVQLIGSSAHLVPSHLPCPHPQSIPFHTISPIPLPPFAPCGDSDKCFSIFKLHKLQNSEIYKWFRIYFKPSSQFQVSSHWLIHNTAWPNDDSAFAMHISPSLSLSLSLFANKSSFRAVLFAWAWAM